MLSEDYIFSDPYPLYIIMFCIKLAPSSRRELPDLLGALSVQAWEANVNLSLTGDNVVSTCVTNVRYKYL